MARKRYFDRTTGKFRKRQGGRSVLIPDRPAPGPNPYDAELIRCQCGKLGFDTREDAELCLDLDRIHTLYQCRSGFWHASRDTRTR